MTNQQQPLRILHCANFSEKKYGAVYYATDRKISNGLIRNGHFVHDFSYRDIARYHAPLRIKKLGIGQMNELLLETTRNIRPDLLLLGHSELVSNETLHNFRTRFPDTRIAMYWVDPLEGFRVNKWFFETRINLVDHFFLTTDPLQIKSVLNINKAPEHLHFMPNICDSTIDTGRAFDLSHYRHDLLFIGRSDSRRAGLIDFLKTGLPEINLGLYGLSKENLVLGEAYIDLLSNCRMAVNYSRFNDIPLYSSDRMVHLAANGCLVLTPRTPEMESVFSEEEVVYFGDFVELKEKVLYYLDHEDETRHKAEAGWARAHCDYNSQKITQDMLTKIISFGV